MISAANNTKLTSMMSYSKFFIEYRCMWKVKIMTDQFKARIKRLVTLKHELNKSQAGLCFFLFSPSSLNWVSLHQPLTPFILAISAKASYTFFKSPFSALN